MPFTKPRHWLRWLLAALAVLIVLAVAGPFIYIHFFNGSTPAALSLKNQPSSTATASTAATSTATANTAAAGPVAGTWTVGSGSIVGYRVNEVLLGQNATAVGRTTSVTGHLVIAGTTVSTASFSVPMATVHSDKSQRDAQFDGRIMNVAQYPTGSFALTSPIDLAPLPAGGAIKDYTAHGRLTLHGTTRAVTFTLTAERKGSQIEVSGDIPVLFSDYNIQNPSFAGFVTTQDHGLLEFLLVFNRT
ncbi:MAG TPA: YceI family protein [Streptosporangiaceae bacterium]|nr:YceI family protein [Streptosporangiaceae bacterium]